MTRFDRHSAAARQARRERAVARPELRPATADDVRRVFPASVTIPALRVLPPDVRAAIDAALTERRP